MSRRLRAGLGKLRAAAGQLPGSKLSQAQREALAVFARQTGAVTIEPSGRGVIYRIAEASVVEQHWRNLTPDEAASQDTTLPLRSVNIAQARGSKSARHGHDVHYLLLKAAGPVIWQDHNGQRLNLQQATQQQGAAVLAIHKGPQRDSGWYTSDTLWLVENQALFDRLDWLPDASPQTVAYYAGHVRDDLLEWLAARPRAATIKFFPDYDGVGLLNFARVKLRLGESVSLWLMPHWESHLSRYGNNHLWQKTAVAFTAALGQLAPVLATEPELRRLIDAMQTQGLALEQEAVWHGRDWE
ncbi:MAG: hypothetical protein NWQ11_10735 [Pseudomonadales bacterium]|jgi:hypothetical protein|nr:hypothetical protein [Pseudomonadales bacterium]